MTTDPAPDAGPLDPADRARLDATVVGRVQGVGYRYHVLRAGTTLSVRGWVRNEPDGSVRCVAEGPRSALERLLATLRAGPPGAVVTRVDTTWHRAAGDLGTFTIRSGAHPGD